MTLETKKISFAIPVFQNEGSLKNLYEKTLELFHTELKEYSYEFCFTNDGSTDLSLNELLKLREKDPNVRITDFYGNFGQVAATVVAQKMARGDAIITMSADLQDPLELIPTMIKEWEKGSELVICYREGRNDTWLSKITSKFYYSLINYHAKNKIPIGGFDYYLISKKTQNSFSLISDNARMRSMQYDLLTLGIKPKLLPYTRLKREVGESQYNISKRFFLFIDGLISISYLPIRFMSLLGLIFSFSSFIYSISIVYAWFSKGVPFKGWAPIMIMLLFIGGMLMLMLGIIGEYVWRIHLEVKKRPNYFINEVYD